MQIVEKKISELKPYEWNAKLHSEEQIEILMNSLETFGWKSAIVIDRQGTIVAGHGRYIAAKELVKSKKKEKYTWNNGKPYDWNIIPCVLADDLSDDEIKAYRLVDNRSASVDYDIDIELAEIENIELDLSDYGIESFDMDDFQEVSRGEGSGSARDKGEYFTSTFVFPIAKKEVVEKYLRKFKNEIVEDIILDAEDYDSSKDKSKN